MMENVRAGRTPARFLTLILGLLLLAALGAGAIAVQARAQSNPPKKLSEEELLSQITAAPQNAPNFSATATLEQTLVPEGLLGASKGDSGSSSGPRSVRIWYGGPDKLRAELQGQNGDQVFVRNGSKVQSYDGATNTLKTGEKQQQSSDTSQNAASPDKINEFLANIAPSSDLRTGDPVQVAGRWAYPLALAPKDKSQTLVDRAEAFVDAEAFVPLSFDLYAKNTPDPVVRYQASAFQVGSVPDQQFNLQTPPGAQATTMEPRANDQTKKDPGKSREASKVASVAEAQKLVNFPVKQLAEAPGGRKLTEVRTTGSGGVILNYGSDWGTVVLTQKPENTSETSGQGTQDQTKNGQKESQVPTVDLGGGVEAKEISTPIGATLSWSSNGVSYSLKGSVPASDLEGAARGLLSS